MSKTPKELGRDFYYLKKLQEERGVNEEQDFYLRGSFKERMDRMERLIIAIAANLSVPKPE